MPYNKLPRLRDPQKRDFVNQVRELFLEKYKQEPELYYKDDVKQVEEMQFLMQRCIISKRKDVKESLNMLVNMLKWRKHVRLRELADQDFPVEYFTLGAAFVYEPDKYGNMTLYIRTQLLKAEPELKASFKEFIAYLMYQIDDSVLGNSWSVVFDLTNTSWSNYDIDLLMHFLTLLKDYFPVSVDYVLAINFPWVMSAAWTLAKRLIPPERRDVVIFIQSSSIFTYIDEQNVPDFLSGQCKTPYREAPKGCLGVVEYLLSQRDPELSKKRIKDIIKSLTEVVPKEHVPHMYKQLEDSGRQ